MTFTIGAPPSKRVTVILLLMTDLFGLTRGGAERWLKIGPITFQASELAKLTVALAREMLSLAGQPDADVEAVLRDGRAMDAWRAMIRAQDGDPDAPLPQPRETHVVTAAEASHEGARS